MSQSELRAFQVFVLQDGAARESLRHDLAMIDDPAEFVVAAVTAASQHGFDVQEVDVRSAMQDARRAWIERWI